MTPKATPAQIRTLIINKLGKNRLRQPYTQGKTETISDFRSEPKKRSVMVDKYRKKLDKRLKQMRIPANELEYINQLFRRATNFQFWESQTYDGVMVNIDGLYGFRPFIAETLPRVQPTAQWIFVEVLRELTKETDRKYFTEVLDEYLDHMTPASNLEPITRVVPHALFYFYLKSKGHSTPFDNGTAEDAYKAIAEDIGTTPGYFKNSFLKMLKTNNRQHPGNIANLEDAIKLLEDYPDAKEKAEDDLKTARGTL